LFGLENLLVCFLAVRLGNLLDGRSGPRLGPPAPAVTGLERRFALATVALNTFVTWVGWHLWKAGWIHIRSEGIGASLLDAAALLLIMDAAMYVLHRVAHHPWIYRLVHGLHHRFDAPRPLTLFVMHPLEVLGFGSLWLAVIALRSPTWGGMAIYLGLNVLFGIVGHLGVEPVRLPPGMAGWLGTARFHGDHHRNPKGNFGFYTRIWDRLMGTHQGSPSYTGDR
jgi:lathosterol oxidase